MMSGQIARSTSVVLGNSNGTTMSNGTRESPTFSSPLQIFVRAKKQINDIFLEIETYIEDVCKFVHGNLHFSPVYEMTCADNVYPSSFT